MGETGNRVTIIVACISLVASIGVALISNWDKFSSGGIRESDSTQRSSAERTEPAAQAAQPMATTITGSPTVTPPVQPLTIQVGGMWRDVADPNFSNSIDQSGETFSFQRSGYLDNGVWFESYGTGQVSGTSVSTQYSTRYSTSDRSTGQCGGTLSLQGDRMNLNCRDSLLGIFPVNLER